MHRAVTIQKTDGKPGRVYYPLKLQEISTPNPKENELLIQLSAASLNHRDLFIRQHLYPGTTFDVPLLADGVGTVISTGSSSQLDSKWLGKRVVLTPGRGWADAAEGPTPEEGGSYAILGGTKTCPLGTLQERVVVSADEVEEAPPHLSTAEAAALPLAGLTAYRAVFSKTGGNAVPGRNILITGIGGGVALMALIFASANGCNVYVTSGSDEKLLRAKELGAQGGVKYNEEGWEKKLMAQLPATRDYFDAVIDGAGGDVVDKAAKILKPGGVIVSYGMTLGPKINYPMTAVLKNIEVHGSTMGSRREFAEMIHFVQSKLLRPVVSRTLKIEIDNLPAIDSLFEEMKHGSQFGKLVIAFGSDEKSRL